MLGPRLCRAVISATGRMARQRLTGSRNMGSCIAGPDEAGGKVEFETERVKTPVAGIDH
jgi:hypothetical protein